MSKFWIFFLFTTGSVMAQNKLEREYRVKTEQVPLQALNCIHKLNLQGNIKWYFEEGLNGVSYEAKTKHHKQYYSVEFDTLGKLLDVEILMHPSQIPAQILQKIVFDLNQRFKKYKIDRTQVQYTGTVEAVLQLISQNQNQDLTTKYELVVKANRKLFEILFSDKGDFEQIAEIIPKNSFHLEF